VILTHSIDGSTQTSPKMAKVLTLKVVAMLLDKGMNTMPHILCEGPQHRHHLLSSSISLFSLLPYMRSINPNHTWSCLQLKLLSLKLSYPSHQSPFFYCCSLPHNNYTTFMICCNWSINPNHTWSCLQLKLFFLKVSYPLTLIAFLLLLLSSSQQL